MVGLDGILYRNFVYWIGNIPKMPNEDKLKQIQEEIDLFNEKIKEIKPIKREENNVDYIQKIKSPKNFRLILVLLLLGVFLFPPIHSLFSYLISNYNLQIRNEKRTEILNRVSYKYEEFYIGYELYPFMIADETTIKVYADSIKNNSGELLVPGQTLDKIDVKEFGFEKLEVGRSGCQNYLETTDSKMLWICFEQNTNELGVLLENSPELYKIQL